MEVILDTNALSAWLDGDQAIGKVLEHASQLFLSPIVLGEYRFGIKASRHRSDYEDRLAMIDEDLPVVTIDATTAQYYAQIRHELKSQGTPIPWHDIWIAAQARQHSLAIISQDRHFDFVLKITRISW